MKSPGPYFGVKWCPLCPAAPRVNLKQNEKRRWQQTHIALHKVCPCGQPLHYSHPDTQAQVEALIRELGLHTKVRVGNKTWLVSRHYIALHGLKASELGKLGFEEAS